jgi:hypothetical protein
MNKVLEELARVIGRAWAREWLESVDEQIPSSRQDPALNTGTLNADTQDPLPGNHEDQFRGNS